MPACEATDSTAPAAQLSDGPERDLAGPSREPSAQSDPCLASDTIMCPHEHRLAGGMDPMSIVNSILPFTRSPFGRGRGGGGAMLFPGMGGPMVGAVPGAPLAERQRASRACECSEAAPDSNDDAEDGTATLEGLNDAITRPEDVSGCAPHLDHPLCRPCGEGCVGNPFCGAGRSWCRVRDPAACPLQGMVPLTPSGCVGPYPPGYASCEARVEAAVAASRPGADTSSSSSSSSLAPLSAGSTPVTATSQVVVARRAGRSGVSAAEASARCDAQRSLAASGYCPEPTADQVASAADPPAELHLARHCHDRPVASFGSFVRHILDAVEGPMAAIAREAGEEEEQADEAMRRFVRNHSIAALLDPKTSATTAAAAAAAATGTAADGPPATASSLPSSEPSPSPSPSPPPAAPVADRARFAAGPSALDAGRAAEPSAELGATQGLGATSSKDDMAGAGGASSDPPASATGTQAAAGGWWPTSVWGWAEYALVAAVVVAGALAAWRRQAASGGGGARSRRARRHRVPQWSGAGGGGAGGEAPFSDGLGDDDDVVLGRAADEAGGGGLFEPFTDDPELAEPRHRK